MAMTGILGTKLGMTQVFDETGQVVPVTVVQAGPCVVTAVRTPDNDGYSAVQIGYGEINPRKVTKPVGRPVREGRGDATPVCRRDPHPGRLQYQLGQEILATLFEAGQRVDVTGKSKGKGTAGVMKRHGFKGLRPRTARSASTARPAPSAPAPPPAGFSRACGWLAGWAPSGSPCRA